MKSEAGAGTAIANDSCARKTLLSAYPTIASSRRDSVEPQQTAEAFTALDTPHRIRTRLPVDQPVPEALVVAFEVVCSAYSSITRRGCRLPTG